MKKVSERLADIAEVRIGINEPVDHQGTVPFIQAKDFTEGCFTPTNLYKVKESEVLGRGVLSPGEILLAGKGKTFSSLWQGEIPDAVASSTFFIIQPDTSRVLPEYLLWFLNSPMALKQLQAETKTTTVTHIRKSSVEELEISLPDLARQKKILQVVKLINEEKKLSDEIISGKEKILNYLLENEDYE